MKKILKVIGVLLVVFILITAYQFFHYDNRYTVKSTTYEEYTPRNDYETTYPVDNYVDERMDAFAILRTGIIGSMIRYDDFANQDESLGTKFDILINIIRDRRLYTKFTQEHQYVETVPITLKYVGEDYDHNFQYTGVLADGTKITGNLAIWGDATNVSTAISFQDGKGNIDEEKAALFTDDSNAEMMAYLMIEAIQDYFDTNYEPNEASLKFFNCSLEDVAGSISYHAATSLASTEVEVGDVTLDKVKTANISTVDDDGYLVNQSY